MDNGVPTNNLASRTYVAPQRTATLSTGLIDEYLVGYSFYDLQTNASISNRLVVNDDNSIAAAWTFSPNATTNFPDRGTGYNYSSDGGTTWLFPTVIGVSQGPSTRTESVRTGFTNIVNCTGGSEMSIQHTGTAMSLNYRPAKGTGAWTISYPWGTANNDTWPKAIASGDNVYAIWQGSGTTGTPTLGQDGPMFLSISNDGGVTWSTKSVISLIDSTHYLGFGGDDYSIDVKGNTVAIVVGNQLSDIVLLKSTDAGATWASTVIYQHPIPMYDLNTMISDTNADGIFDTLMSTSGDAAVLIDDNDLCHVWMSDFRWYCDLSTVGSYNYFPSTDGLEYWNENMATGAYVLIAAAEDLNGNGVLDAPGDETCSGVGLAWGNYRGGITGMPSAGIDMSNGRMYVSYQTIDELADTALYHQAHRHVYMIASDDHGLTWSSPVDIVPTIADGGDGENQEAVFAAMAKRVVNNTAYVLYQRDPYPGHALAAAGTCDLANNLGNSSDLVFARLDAAIVSTGNLDNNNLFVSQNYPNPASASTSIKVTLKKSADVTITVSDIIGQVVFSQTQNNVNAGTQVINLNTANWHSGVYTYTVTSGDQKTSRQMIVQ
ncbi:MAG: T9SS type A sorting domain-containing protein [Bacteroidetes bacterium]|nr:T9SS type A sorting domain-containing protein [Bacteroidota bacterium]